MIFSCVAARGVKARLHSLLLTRAFAAGVLALSWGAPAPASAKPISLPEQNLSLEVPDDWSTQSTPLSILTSSPKPIFTAASPDQAQCVLMVCDNLQQFTASDPTLTANLKTNVDRIATSHGAVVQFNGDQAVQLNDVPAHTMQYTLVLLNGKRLLCRSYAIAGNDRLYLVLTQAQTADQDQALNRVVASLRFDPAPRLPYRHWGRRMIAFVAILVLAGMALIGGGVAWLVYRRRA